MTTTPRHQERVKRLSVILPSEIADEISELSTPAKAQLMCEIADEINESIDAFPDLNLSATTTQWLKALNTREACQLIENLSLQLMNEVKK